MEKTHTELIFRSHAIHILVHKNKIYQSNSQSVHNIEYFEVLLQPIKPITKFSWETFCFGAFGWVWGSSRWSGKKCFNLCQTQNCTLTFSPPPPIPPLSPFLSFFPSLGLIPTNLLICIPSLSFKLCIFFSLLTAPSLYGHVNYSLLCLLIAPSKLYLFDDSKEALK